jgi:hypothetical protein
MQKLETASGTLTLVGGLVTLLVLGFGPWTCDRGGSPCYGTLGDVWPLRPDIMRWLLDTTAWLLIWWPGACFAVLGLGALRNGMGRASRLPQYRWLMLAGLTPPTTILLITTAIGLYMVPAFLVAWWTAIVGEAQSRRALAPRSVGGLDLAALASIPALGIVALSCGWVVLILQK